MIYDGHAYCFPNLGGDGGFADPEQFRRHLQLGMARHFMPAWRKRDRAPANDLGLADPDGGWSFDTLNDVDFKAASHGKFEWTVDGETYVKQYMVPSVVDMTYPAESLVAEMDYAGVDMALIHRTPYLGISNEFIGDCTAQFPDRLQGLAHVEEWLIPADPRGSYEKLKRAVAEPGIVGLQFLPDQIPLYNQSEDWTGPEFRPFWDGVAELGIPVFITPSGKSLSDEGLSPAEVLATQLRSVGVLLERYSDMNVVVTHGLIWRTFVDGETLAIPDEVFDAMPADNPRFSLQLLFAIALGGIWEYPMLQVRDTMKQLVDRLGADRLMWGTDIPMVMRFYTYRQNLAHIRHVSDFLTPEEVGLITGGNTARLLGLKGE
jgi:predicted TIM-barrel fold metal-dependent hydrolase